MAYQYKLIIHPFHILIFIFSAAPIGRYPRGMDDVRRQYFRPRGSAKSSFPIYMKIGTHIHFGSEICTSGINFSKVNFSHLFLVINLISKNL